jgi:hypothetical protein
MRRDGVSPARKRRVSAENETSRVSGDTLRGAIFENNTFPAPPRPIL